jgi:NADH-ubiquinone oxidoreductase chain 5
LLINRIGDRIFICRIALIFLTCSNTTFFSSFNYYNIICFFLVFTFITKRAIFPFSPWLPAAIAAPTPISALVHSSTLVASGLFLIMRFNYIIYYSYNLTYILIILSIFTSFYAGLNTLFEKDIKKLIALSTLRHLGFISLAFSCGFLYLAFFHIVSHALFKSLLFITIGDIMHYSNHSQDIRFLPTGIFYTPSSCFVMFVCLFNLLGLPSLSGFFF